MKKRLIPLLLTATLALSLCPASLAHNGVSTPVEEASQVITALDIMVGDGSGDLQLTRPVTRAEFITLAVKASPYAGQVGQASVSPFPDVPYTHWSAGFVQMGVSQGYISGYLDGTFRPDSRITLAEGCTILLKLLGYSGGDFSGAYPTGQMALFRSLKLDTDLTASQAEDVLTRQDAMYMFYNLLTTRTKTGTVYLTQLGYPTTASGEIDRVALINNTMEGPVVAAGDWQAQLPFDVNEGTAVFRDGVASHLSAIESHDVVYYSKSMRTLWVYHDRVSGSIQGVTLSASNSPASVTVAGRAYAIETAQAAYDLSELGKWRVGDQVTLLLGRTGGVAAVESPAAAGGTALVGIVTAVGTGTFPAAEGGTYTAKSVTFTATDGSSYSYELRDTPSFSVGDVVQVSVKEGVVTVRHASSSQLSGRVSADATTLGRYALARNVEILDYYGAQGSVQVYPSRLAGMSLTTSQIRYYSLNSQGEIDRLILKEATGDGYSYGILTDLVDTSFGMTINVLYQLDIGGVPAAIQSSTTRYPVKEGPIQVQGPLNDVERLVNLTEVKLDRLTSAAAYAGNRSYTLWDGAAVYEYRNGTYYLSSLERVLDGDFTVTAWYDKEETSGGRIRVLVAK